MPTAPPTVSSAPTPLYHPSSSPSSSALPSFPPSPAPTDSPGSASSDMTDSPTTFAPDTANDASITEESNDLDLAPPASAPASIFPTITSPPVEKLDTGDEEKPTVNKDIVCLESTSNATDSRALQEESVSASTCVDDADPYRTCLWQTTTVEKCDRMVKSKPFVGKDETLIEGTLILTLAQNPVATSCRNTIQMEKALLTFLADNVGSEDTYQPACVYTVNSARDIQQNDDSTIESTALEYKLSFVQKNSFQIFQRKLQDTCSDADRAICCSQHAINGALGEYCTSLGCDISRCGEGRRPRKKRRNDDRELQVGSNPYYLFGRPLPIDEPRIGDKPNVNACSFYGQLAEFEFNDVVNIYSEFKPEMSRSLLGVEDLESAAVCSSNRYSIEVLGTPALTCDQYSDSDCSENEDLAPGEDIEKKTMALTVPMDGGLEVASDESSALDGPARVSPANDGTEKVVEVHNDNLAHKEKVLISSGRTASMQCIVLPAALGLLFGCVVM